MWRLIMLTVRLILILFAGQMTIIVGTKLVSQGDAQYDPLVLYQALLPGAPMTALANHPCRWQSGSTGPEVSASCQSFLEGEHFVSMNVYARGRLIQVITFRVANLRVGDLPQSWGVPMIIANYGLYSFARWNVGGYQVTAYLNTRQQPNYHWLPVSSITVRQRASSD
jgi:hypothetical protein